LLEESGNLKSETTELENKIKASEASLKLEILDYKSVSARLQILESLAELLLEIDQANQNTEIAKQTATTERLELEKLPKHDSFGKIEDAEAQLEAHKGAYESAVATGASTLKAANSLASGIKQLKSLQGTRNKVSGSNKAIIDLAKWADGSNNLSQKLPAFVLQAMFEEVVDAANSRFSTILEGRYELRIPETEVGPKTTRGTKGLDLVVRDRLTEMDRKPSTLSGGEQFCAALSLALGLSDIVLSNNSGLSIDTFFIDEGFGSLDSDRLSQVMQMLDRLKADGRTIGLISHVDEMKAAIAEHVDVKPIGASGKSTISVSWMEFLA
jgi:exonuclease SbcC